MAENKKNIDQLINESLQSNDLDFDDFSWTDVKNKLDTSTTVDKVVFSALNPAPTQLPDSAWEDMNDALDIETVWKRLEKQPKRKPVVFWWKVASIVTFLSLMGYQLNNYIKPLEINEQLTHQQVINLNKDNNIPFEINDTKIKNQQTISKKNSNIQENNVKNSSSEKIFNNKTSNVHNFGTNINTDSGSNNFINKKEIDKIKLNNLKNFRLTIRKKVDELANFSDSVSLPIENNKFVIGLVGEVNNTWISDVETRLGYSKNSLVYNDFSITPSYGVFIDYKITPRLTFGTEFFINSLMKTKNNLYVDGELAKKETDLEYFKSTFSLSKGIKINKLKERNTLQFLGGFYFSYLKRSSVKYNNVITNINSNYKLFDYGLKGGIYHNLNFNKFNFSYGLQTTYGLNNVFDGKNKPSYLNNTRNISYGLNIKLGYKL